MVVPASCQLPADVGTGAGTGRPGSVGTGVGGTFPRMEGPRRVLPQPRGTWPRGPGKVVLAAGTPTPPSQGSPPGRGWDWCGAQGSSEQSWPLMGAALAPQPGTQPHHQPHQHPRHKPVCEDKPGPGILLVPVAAGRVLPAKGAPGPGASSPSQGVRCGGAVGTGREGTPHPLTFPGLSWLTAFPAALCLRGCGHRAPPAFLCAPGTRRGCTPAPRSHRGTPRGRAQGPRPGPGTDRPCARDRHGTDMGCTRDAHMGCRCGVLTGGVSPRPPGMGQRRCGAAGAVPWVLSCGCRGSCTVPWAPQPGARWPCHCCGRSPARPLKSGNFLSRFYGPICLHRVLPPP